MIPLAKSDSCEQFERLINILKKLRGDGGCPWDIDQTSKSLIPYLLEETYEVIEAIEDNNSDALKEELGDLTLHVLFQGQIAEEKGKFQIADSLKGICDKLVRRHPHIFKNKDNLNVDDELLNWETAKRKEKKRGNYLDGVPKNLPALTRARRIQEKAALVGFDWKEIEPVWSKVHEEIRELEEAFSGGDFEKIEEELGDTLFALVNLGRFMNISSEDALRKTISKFETRFSGIERRLKSKNRSLEEATLEEMDEIWEEEKKK